MSQPATETVPSVKVTIPQMMLISVVLPAPFGPSSAKISPRRISRLTPSRARKPEAYVFETLETEMIGCMVKQRWLRAIADTAACIRPNVADGGNRPAATERVGFCLLALRTRPHVLDRRQHPLRRRRRVETRRQPMVGEARDGVPYGEPNGDRQHQRRLADRLGAEDGRGAVWRVLEQPRIEDRRQVAAAGNFVGRWAVSAQPTFAIPPQLFGGEPAHSLDECALDLAEVDRRIERATAILDELGTQHARFAGQRIDRNLGGGRAVDEVIERPPGIGGKIPVNLRRAVEARRRQRYAFLPRQRRKLGE